MPVLFTEGLNGSSVSLLFKPSQLWVPSSFPQHSKGSPTALDPTFLHKSWENTSTTSLSPLSCQHRVASGSMVAFEPCQTHLLQAISYSWFPKRRLAQEPGAGGGRLCQSLARSASHTWAEWPIPTLLRARRLRTQENPQYSFQRKENLPPLGLCQHTWRDTALTLFFLDMAPLHWVKQWLAHH